MDQLSSLPVPPNVPDPHQDQKLSTYVGDQACFVITANILVLPNPPGLIQEQCRAYEKRLERKVMLSNSIANFVGSVNVEYDATFYLQ
ncbi:hypothetical protein E2562_007444 [Oryza meyeriana var. granulata]|uniref:Uncharacterized protein n=1 Tax=Oryza meyeriana var. granulata TaxID=110450 RepID=A0A6G1D0H1_9ORYZ|nr:hypothetical protein E2562_007444 [Oryza meyeriana var. granulata]